MFLALENGSKQVIKVIVLFVKHISFDKWVVACQYNYNREILDICQKKMS